MIFLVEPGISILGDCSCSTNMSCNGNENCSYSACMDTPCLGKGNEVCVTPTGIKSTINGITVIQ